MREFYGYRRPDGKVGVRNHVLILPCSVCCSDLAQQVAAQVAGTVSFHNQNGCSQPGKDLQLTLDTMAGFAANPNIYGTVLVALGCETAQIEMVEEAIRARTNKPLEGFVIQREGGTLSCMQKAVRAAQKMCAEAQLARREPFPVSELIVAVECGGSDPTSGLAANPVCGNMADLIVEEGGTVILSETTEMIGAEHILAARAASPEISEKILGIVRRYEENLHQAGEEVRSANPSPGNKRGGISTLEEKSLGCIHKGGTTKITDVVDYSKPVSAKGLVIMDTPGNDPSSVAGMAAGGAQITVFTTGLGTPMGNPVVPVVKMTGNRETFAMMEDNTDFDASGVLFGEASMDGLGLQLLELVIETANGRQTKAESLGFNEIAIMRAANYC